MYLKLKIDFTNICIAILLMPPLLFFFLNGTNLVKQTSTLILLSFILVMFIYKYTKIKKTMLDYMMIIYLLYVVLDINYKQIFVHNYFSLRDIGELTRIIFVYISFKLGSFLYKEDINYKKITNTLIIIYSALIIGFFLKIPFLNFLYNSEVHRFSGTMPGINYIWIPLIILFFMYEYSEKGLLLVFFIYSVIAISLLFSYSFTSIIIVCFTMLLYNLSSSIHSVRKIFVFLIMIFLGCIILNFIFDYLVSINFLSIDQVKKMHNVSLFLNDFDLTHFSSLQKRFCYWNNVLEKVLDYPISGHGSDKSNLSYTDNSYLMTLYRYGIIGLALELCILSVLLKEFFIQLFSKRNNEYYLPFFLLTGQLVSSITTNVFYELKAPYILFFIYGYFYTRTKYEKNNIPYHC